MQLLNEIFLHCEPSSEKVALSAQKNGKS